MSLDRDGNVRMDCSSPYAMAPLVAVRDRFDIAFGNDPDSDPNGIVTLNPNHDLTASDSHLFTHRPA